MTREDSGRIVRLRLKPLAACFTTVFAISVSAAIAAQGHRGVFHHITADSGALAATGTIWAPGYLDARSLSNATARPHAGSGNKPSAASVTNCNDDGMGGTLREAVASAMDGDAIDLTQLGCSSITLLMGEIHVNVDSLTVNGPGSQYLTIDGAASLSAVHRIFDHTGGGILKLTGITITDAYYTGVLAKGGCIYSAGSVYLLASVVSYCALEAPAGSGAYALGGAIYSRNAVGLVSSTVTRNQANAEDNGAYGGGIFTRGNLTTQYSTISNNTVSSADPPSFPRGGGVYATGNADVKIQTTTLYGNQAESAGGIFVGYGSGTVAMINSTISSNIGTLYTGGGVFFKPTSISNSTIVSNIGGSALYGVGINASQTLTAQSSIFADNFAGNEESDIWTFFGAIYGGDDLIMATISLTPPNTWTGLCPRLSPLRDNGGPTKTHALLSDSLGIDFGDNALIQPTDQRGSGFSRTFGAGTDMGAVEWQGNPSESIFSSAFELRCDRGT